MALCDNCIFYRKEFDEFRQQYVDAVVVGSEEPEEHFCQMYTDHIPSGIFYNNEKCEFYLNKEDFNEQVQT